MRIRITLAALAITAAAAGCTATDPKPELVHCPAEDSCQVDYRDGAYWLRTFDDPPTNQVPGPWVRVSK